MKFRGPQGAAMTVCNCGGHDGPHGPGPGPRGRGAMGPGTL